MASSDNVTNENPIGFEDGEYDPDLEARLYAEIYYSNENYTPDYESQTDKVTQHISEEAATNRTSTTLSASNECVADAAQHDTQVELPSDNFVEGSAPGNEIDDQNFYIGRTYYPNRNSVFGRAIESNRGSTGQPSVGPRSVGKRRRQLAQKGLWLALENNEGDGSALGERNVETIRQDNPTQESCANSPIVGRSPVENPENDVVRNDSSRKQAKRNTRRQKQRRLKKNVSKRACGKTTPREYDASELTDETCATDKYEVVSKKTKMKSKKKNSVPLEISSDSDDSILEVPVPPKAPPLIIQLADSDDDCDRSNEDGSKKAKKSDIGEHDEAVTPCDIEEDSTTNNPPSELPATESVPSETNESVEEARDNVGNSDELPVAFTQHEGEALILNCTGIQRGASSLDEIRSMRDTAPPICAHSDDSMTESEANNWGSIAAGQSNASRDHDVCSTDLSNDTINVELCDRSVHEKPTSTGIPAEVPISSGDGSAVDRTVANKEKISNVSTPNKDAAAPRKRQKEAASRPFTDFGVPAIPRKRSKRIRDKAMTDYFFKPMSKEMQAHYNDPWGGENLTLHDIQSRMPENPRCWGILDADLQGPSYKKRRICGRCNTESHVGRRCPEKPKTPCCHMCGVMGHTESRCPDTMCLTCGRKYATYRQTCDYCSRLYCNMCNGYGHSHESCPDLWRRYHNTTTETMPVAPGDVSHIMKSPNQLCCCNCGKRGHDATTCRQLRWSQHFPTPTFVSSYTEGPFYESSYSEQTHEPSPNEHSFHDVSHDESVYRPNITGDRNYAPPHEERVEETTVRNDIEIIEINDDQDAPIAEPASSTASSKVLFQVGGIAQSKAVRMLRASRRLDQIENVHLDGFLNGRLKPTFLRDLRNSFRFSVAITRESREKVLMIVESKSPALIDGLWKLVVQWLTRTDEEKPYLEYSALPYGKREMHESVQKKLALLERVMEPVLLWRKIVACEDSLKHIRAKKGRCVNDGKFQDKMTKIEDREGAVLTRRRNELTTSLYGLSWVEGGDAVVRSFRKIAGRLGPGKNFPPRQYLELIYLNNELFTFHTSDALSRALGAALMASGPPQSIIEPVANQPSIDASCSKAPETVARPIAIVRVGETENSFESPAHLSNEPMAADDGSAAHSSLIGPRDERPITVVERNTPVPKMFGAPQAVNSCNNDDGPGTGQVLNPAYRPVTVNGVDSQNSSRTKIVKAFVGKRKIPASQGLLIDLPKRKRKVYRRAAKKAIKVALLTRQPHLEEMAKALRRKSGTDTVTTDDVDMLRNAIGPDLTRVISKRLAAAKSETRKQKKNAKNAYQSSLKRL